METVPEEGENPRRYKLGYPVSLFYGYTLELYLETFLKTVAHEYNVGM